MIIEIEISDKHKDFFMENENKIKLRLKKSFTDFYKKNFVPKDEKIIELYEFIRDIAIQDNTLTFHDDGSEYFLKDVKEKVEIKSWGNIHIYTENGILIITRKNNIKNYESIVVDDGKINEIINRGYL
jgi:hypothetical protein